jgi:dTDP-4-dehydrorhamnose 3,5-epimerase-like enzyme
MTKHLKPIHTTDAEGYRNGLVLPIWNAAFDEYRPQQAYITTIAVGASKGPHLHHKRDGAFTCIVGSILIVTRVNGEYREVACGDGPGYKTVHVLRGTPCTLYNIGTTEAVVLNMPNPSWRDNSDENKVPDWTYSLER